MLGTKMSSEDERESTFFVIKSKQSLLTSFRCQTMSSYYQYTSYKAYFICDWGTSTCNVKTTFQVHAPHNMHGFYDNQISIPSVKKMHYVLETTPIKE